TQECYYTTNLNWFTSVLQDQLLEGLFLGNAGRMVWPHWMVDRANSWSVFKSVLNFVDDVPLNRKTWSSSQVSAKTSSVKDESTFSKLIEVKGYGNIPSSGAKAPRNYFQISNVQSSQFLEGFAAGSGWQGHVLHGRKHSDLRNPPTFEIDIPHAATMFVRVKLVAA